MTHIKMIPLPQQTIEKILEVLERIINSDYEDTSIPQTVYFRIQELQNELEDVLFDEGV